MAKDLRVVHRDAAGRKVEVAAAAATGVPLTAREPVWAPRRHPSERSIVTWWWSSTTREFVGCRSLERMSVAMLLDFNPNVVDFTAWSVVLEWTERGRVRRIVPDFFVRTAAGGTVVVACPPVSGPSSRWQRQMQVLREACEEAGWELGSPRLPHATALANLRWVSRYRHPRNGDRDVERALVKAFVEPRPLMEGVEAAGVPRLLALPRLYHLLWRRGLAVDWSVALGPGSVVQQGGHLPQAMHRPFTVEEQS
ncbi:TnsA-like heteromeric transposase endonuclease subunit [Streptomyces lydicus]|uniref:TnsA-like heteromeric transposase endonuclease subunit n=1 Tax=Streptomyces lydicus TaxID=47763 RepID=UPI0037AAB368